MVEMIVKLCVFAVSLFVTLYYGTVLVYNVAVANKLSPRLLLFTVMGIVGMVVVLFMGYFH